MNNVIIKIKQWFFDIKEKINQNKISEIIKKEEIPEKFQHWFGVYNSS